MPPKRFLGSLLIEFGPVTVFFFGAMIYSFLVGVALLMLAVVLSLVASLWRDRRVPLFSLISSVFILIAGAIALYMQSPFWVVVEYSVSNAVFGLLLLAGYAQDRPALEPMFGALFRLTHRGWLTLTLRWGMFFLATAIASEIVWRLWSFDAWAVFRFSMAIAMAAFGFSQFFLARRERLPDASLWGLAE